MQPRFPRDKDQLLREVDMAMRLGEIRRSHRLKERLAPGWFEPVLTATMFVSALGLLASMFQYSAVRDEPLNRWMLMWFTVMILSLVMCFQILLYRVYHFRRANDLLMDATDRMRARLEEVEREIAALRAERGE